MKKAQHSAKISIRKQARAGLQPVLSVWCEPCGMIGNNLGSEWHADDLAERHSQWHQVNLDMALAREAEDI